MVRRVGEVGPLGTDPSPFNSLPQFFDRCIHEDDEIAVVNVVDHDRIQLVKGENPVLVVKHAPEPFRHKSADPVVFPQRIPVTDDAGLMFFFPLHGSIPLQFPQEPLVSAVYLDPQRHLPEGVG